MEKKSHCVTHKCRLIMNALPDYCTTIITVYLLRFLSPTANVLSSELEESRLLLDTAERARRSIEAEVADVRDAIGQMTNANSALTVEKRRLEGDVRGMQAELDNLMMQVKNAEEKAKKAMVDAGEFLCCSSVQYLKGKNISLIYKSLNLLPF